jgi:predicted metal-dependent hydrolase
LNTKPKVIGNSQITLGSKVIPYIIKRSLRSKLLWLKITQETGLVVTVPRYYKIESLESYLISKSNWILRNLNKIDNQRTGNVNSFSDQVIYLGIPLNIVKKINDNKVAEIKLEESRLVVNLDPCYRKGHAGEVEIWLKEQAARYINFKARLFSAKMGLSFNKISIRSQKTRWGSCSRAKNLSFNWRLIMAPEPVIEYVVIHELSHLQQMNHSKAFWHLVEKYCADAKKHRKWLNLNSCYLNGNGYSS